MYLRGFLIGKFKGGSEEEFHFILFVDLDRSRGSIEEKS